MVTMMLCDEKYTAYLPLFILFHSLSYPEYAIRIYCTGPIPEDVKQRLRVLEGLSDWRVYENQFADYCQHAFVLKSLRWLVYPPEVRDFECVYIGDVDMLICPEPVSILDHHKLRCRTNNLSYDNRIRPVQSGMDDPGRRLTGLHFATRQWFAETESYRATLSRLARDRSPIPLREAAGTRSNEGLLYNLAERCCGLPPKDSVPAYDYHGIHLGIWREPHRRDPAALLQNPKYMQQMQKDTFLSYYDQYLRAKETQQFSVCAVPEITPILAAMEAFAELWRSQ